MSRSDYKISIFKTEEKFPSTSKMLEVVLHKIQIISNFDVLIASFTKDAQDMESARVMLRINKHDK